MQPQSHTLTLSPAFRDFAYEPRSAWRPLLAIPFIIFLFVCAALVGALLWAGLTAIGVAPSQDGATLVQLAGMQVVVILGVLAATVWRGGSVRDSLSLVSPAGRRVSVYLVAFLLMVAFVSAYTFVVWLLQPSVLLDDLRPFARLIRSEWSPLAMLAVAIGAPVSEELVFRGFLFSSLAASRAGLTGATLVTTSAWAALHAGYSVSGLIEVFLIGLFFCWLLVKTGSLWVPLVCHAVYNGTIMLVLKYAPVPI